LTFEQGIGATGRLKVLRVFPPDKHSADPCYLGRWDEPANTLDFDFVEGEEDHAQPLRPHGHHSSALGDRRFEVELGSDANNIVFKGIVSIALGFRMHLGEGLVAVAGFNSKATVDRPASGPETT
jgi:hypothetical protein